jgi:hypothetical protein
MSLAGEGWNDNFRILLSDFENGRKKGEFGRWILHELSLSWYCSQHAQKSQAADFHKGVG